MPIYSSCALPRGGWCEGVLLCGSRSSVLRAFSARNACFALDEPLSQRVGGFGLSRKPPKLRPWSCIQPRAAEATAAGVAVVAKWDRYRALLPSCDDTRCWRAELGMRHADLRREETAMIAKPASATCMILLCDTWYGCMGVWVGVWCWDERCDGLKKHV